MKKIIFLFLIITASSFGLSSCTEEEVKPQTETGNSGGSPEKE